MVGHRGGSGSNTRGTSPRRTVRAEQGKCCDQGPVCRTVGEPDRAAERLLDGIQLLVRRFAISERADVQCCGVTVSQAATLDALRADGPLRLAVLGRRLGITPSTLTRNLDRLQDAGLVTRQADREDARAGRVGLTPAGRGAAAEVERQRQAFARSVLDRLPADRRQAALSGLSDLLAAVREATEGCCPGAFDHLMTDLPVSAKAEAALWRTR